MGSTIKNLYYGLMATATTTILYTAPTGAGSSCVVKSIIAVNNATGSSTINLLYDPSGTGTPTALIPVNLSLGSGYSMTFTPMVTLGAGDGIIGYASASGVVACTISGVEITP